MFSFLWSVQPKYCSSFKQRQIIIFKFHCIVLV
uniref:Uncharacterized protein n=1 Tax=Anguilla anguilla TaxID=7936 RepID=A0A0E9WU93_ANGAN